MILTWLIESIYNVNNGCVVRLHCRWRTSRVGDSWSELRDANMQVDLGTCGGALEGLQKRSSSAAAARLAAAAVVAPIPAPLPRKREVLVDCPTSACHSSNQPQLRAIEASTGPTVSAYR